MALLWPYWTLLVANTLPGSGQSFRVWALPLREALGHPSV